MKKIVSALIFLCLALSTLNLWVFAQDTAEDFLFETDPYYEYVKILTKCNIQGETIEIPAEYNQTAVRWMDFTHHSIFKGCMSTKRIILPETLLFCGNTYSFTPYTSDGINYSYGEIEFNQWENGQYLGSKDNPYYALVGVIDNTVTEFVMHDDAEIIGYHSFYGCQELRKITLSKNLKSISPDGLQLTYQEHPYNSPLEFNEYGNCLYLGTADNPYYALIQPKVDKVESDKITYSTPAAIHPDTEFIYSFYNGLNDSEITIPQSVKAINLFAFSVTENATVNFEAENQDSLLYPFESASVSETVNMVWGYTSQASDSSGVEESASNENESTSNKENNTIWVWIVAIGAFIAVVSTARFLIKRKKTI